MASQLGFFDVDSRLRELSAKGDDLEHISTLVDFEVFRLDLVRAVPRSDGTKGGRPAFDPVLMFKILLLQAMHGLSDERTEYLIKDRLSFMRFLGLGLSDAVPDANTIWTFREALKRANAVDALFHRFDAVVKGLVISPWAGRSSTLASWQRRSSATPRRSGRRSNRARSRRAG